MWDVNDAHKYCAAAAPPANFSRRPQSGQPFEIGRLGLDVAGAAAHMRSSVGPGAAFECRLDRTSREGPRRAPCEVVARIGGAYDNGTAPVYYDIVIPNPIDVGTYDLRVLWMHASAMEASAPSTKPLCRVLRVGGDERLGKLSASCARYARARLLLLQLAGEPEVGEADRAVVTDALQRLEVFRRQTGAVRARSLRRKSTSSTDSAPTPPRYKASRARRPPKARRRRRQKRPRRARPRRRRRRACGRGRRTKKAP